MGKLRLFYLPKTKPSLNWQEQRDILNFLRLHGFAEALKAVQFPDAPDALLHFHSHKLGIEHTRLVEWQEEDLHLWSKLDKALRLLNLALEHESARHRGLHLAAQLELEYASLLEAQAETLATELVEFFSSLQQGEQRQAPQAVTDYHWYELPPSEPAEFDLSLSRMELQKIELSIRKSFALKQAKLKRYHKRADAPLWLLMVSQHHSAGSGQAAEIWFLSGKRSETGNALLCSSVRMTVIWSWNWCRQAESYSPCYPVIKPL